MLQRANTITDMMKGSKQTEKQKGKKGMRRQSTGMDFAGDVSEALEGKDEHEPPQHASQRAHGLRWQKTSAKRSAFQRVFSGLLRVAI